MAGKGCIHRHAAGTDITLEPLPLVSDEIYDILFSDLQTLESWLGLRMKNSATKKII